MGDILEKVFAVILIVLLIFFFPLLDAFERMDDLSYMTAYTAAEQFVDNVRKNGIITTNMYAEFMRKLDSTGNKYSVEMVHRKSQYYNEKEGSAENIRLDDEITTDQILYNLGYYAYDVTSNSLNIKSPNVNEEYNNFKVGDYFYVSVQNKTLTPATVIKRVLYGSNISELNILISYGGMVADDGKYPEKIEGIYTYSPGEATPVEPPVEPPVVSSLIADNVHIGDYVDYDKFIVGSKTNYIYKESSGHGSDQVISRGNVKWRVLSINVTSKEVALISENPVNSIALGKAKGYLNGETILNNLYNSFYTIEGIGLARNMKVEDVNKIVGYGTSGIPSTAIYLNNYNNEATVAYGTKIEDVETVAMRLIYYDGPYGGVGQQARDYHLTCYYYTGETYRTAGNTAAYNLIFGNSNNFRYWLSSSYVGANFFSGFAFFGMRHVHDGDVTIENLFLNNGGGYSGSFSRAGRPVVELYSSVEVDGGDGSSANPWKIKQ